MVVVAGAVVVVVVVAIASVTSKSRATVGTPPLEEAEQEAWTSWTPGDHREAEDADAGSELGQHRGDGERAR